MNEELFRTFPLFLELSGEQNDLIRPLFIDCQENAGSVLFEQGELADRLYLVVSGEVVIRFKPEDGPAILIAHVRAGGVVGWSTALGNPTYTSSAICTSDSQLLFVRGGDLRDFCEKEPETGSLLLEKLAGIVAERLRTSHSHVIALLEQSLQSAEPKSLTSR